MQPARAPAPRTGRRSRAPCRSLGTGLNASDFGAIAGDQAAGDTHGQGLFQKWYVLGPDGNPIQ